MPSLLYIFDLMDATSLVGMCNKDKMVRSLSLIVIVEMTFYTESVCTIGLALLLEDSDSGYRISIERQGEIHTRL